MEEEQDPSFMEDSMRGSQVPAASSNKAVKATSAPWLPCCMNRPAHARNYLQTHRNRLETHSQHSQNLLSRTAFETQYNQTPGAEQAQKGSFLTVTASTLESFCWHRYLGQGSRLLSQQKACRALGAEMFNPYGKQHLVVACSN